MAKKNSRSNPGSTDPAPARRRSTGANTRLSAATPEVPVVEPDGTPPAVLDRADDMKVQGAVDSFEAGNPSHEEIAEAAYRRYLQRGGGHGQDFDDWVEAERDLRTRS